MLWTCHNDMNYCHKLSKTIFQLLVPLDKLKICSFKLNLTLPLKIEMKEAFTMYSCQLQLNNRKAS
jgi:hypothetical protein